MTYKYLTIEQREKLERLYNAGWLITDLADEFNRSRSSLYAELRRGFTGKIGEFGRNEYSAALAQQTAIANLSKRGNRRHGRKAV